MEEAALQVMDQRAGLVVEHSAPRRSEVLRRDDRVTRAALPLAAAHVEAVAVQAERLQPRLGIPEALVGRDSCGRGQTPRTPEEEGRTAQQPEALVVAAVAARAHPASPWEPLARRTPAVAAVLAVVA